MAQESVLKSITEPHEISVTESLKNAGSFPNINEKISATVLDEPDEQRQQKLVFRDVEESKSAFGSEKQAISDLSKSDGLITTKKFKTEQEVSEQAPQKGFEQTDKDLEPVPKMSDTDLHETVKTKPSSKLSDIRSLKIGDAEKPTPENIDRGDGSLQDEDSKVDSKLQSEIKVSHEKEHIFRDRDFTVSNEADVSHKTSTKTRRQRFAKTKEASDKWFGSESITAEDKSEEGGFKTDGKPEKFQGFIDVKSTPKADKCREAQTVTEQDQMTIRTVKDKTLTVSHLKEINTVQEVGKVRDESLEDKPEITEAKLMPVYEQSGQRESATEKSALPKKRTQKIMNIEDVKDNQVLLKPVLTNDGLPSEDTMTDTRERKEAVSGRPTRSEPQNLSDNVVTEYLPDDQGISEADVPPKKAILSKFVKSSDVLEKEIKLEPVKAKNTTKDDEQQTAEEMINTDRMSKPLGLVVEQDQINTSTVTDRMLKVSLSKERKATEEQVERKVTLINTEGKVPEKEKLPEIRESDFSIIEKVNEADVSPKESPLSKFAKSKDYLGKRIRLKPAVAVDKTKKQTLKNGKMTEGDEKMSKSEEMIDAQGLIVEKDQINITTLKVSPDGEIKHVHDQIKGNVFPSNVGDETFEETASTTGETKDAGSPKVLVSSERKGQKFPQTVDALDKDVLFLLQDKTKKVPKDELPGNDEEQVDQPTVDEMLPIKEKPIKPQKLITEPDKINTSAVKDKTLKVSPLKVKDKTETNSKELTSDKDKQIMIKSEEKQIQSKTTIHLEKASLTSINDSADKDKALPRPMRKANLSEITEGGFAMVEADGSSKERKELDQTEEAVYQKIQPKLVRDKDKTQTDRRATEQPFKIQLFDEPDVSDDIEKSLARKLDQNVAEGSFLKKETLMTKKLQKPKDLTNEFQSSIDQDPDREGWASLTEEKTTKQQPEVVQLIVPSKKQEPVPLQLEQQKRSIAEKVHTTGAMAPDKFNGSKPTQEGPEKVGRKTPKVPLGQEEAETQQRPEDAERDAQIPDNVEKDIRILYKPEKTEVLGKISTEKQLRDLGNAENVTEMDKTIKICPSAEIKILKPETEIARQGQKTEESNHILQSKEATEEQMLDQATVGAQDGTKPKSLKGTENPEKEPWTAVFKKEYGSITPAEKTGTPQTVMKLSVAPVLEVASETSHIAVEDNQISCLKMEQSELKMEVQDETEKLPERPERDELESQVRLEPEVNQVKLTDKTASFPLKHHRRIKHHELIKDGELSPQEVQSRIVEVKQEHGEFSLLFPEIKQPQKSSSAAAVLEVASEKHLMAEVGDFKSDRFQRTTAPDNLEINVETATEKTLGSFTSYTDEIRTEVTEEDVKVKDLARQEAPKTDKITEEKTQKRLKRREKTPDESVMSKTHTIRDDFHDVSQIEKIKQQETELKTSKMPVIDVASEKPLTAHRQKILDTTQRYIAPDYQVENIRSAEIKPGMSDDVSALTETSTKDRMQSSDQPEEIAVNLREPKLEISRKYFVAAEALQGQNTSDQPIRHGHLLYTGDKSDVTVQAKTVLLKAKTDSFGPARERKDSLISESNMIVKDPETAGDRVEHLRDSKKSGPLIEPDVSAGVRHEDKEAEREPTQGQPCFEPSVTDKPKASTAGYPSEHTKTTPHAHSIPPKTHETRTETGPQGMQYFTETRGLTVEPEGKENLGLQESSRGTEGGNCH